MGLTIGPARLLQYSSVIRLTQFIPTVKDGSEAAAQRFLSWWQTAVKGAAAEGIVYRELCRQNAAWSRMAAAEIDNPIEATFLEYLIAEAGTDLACFPALPPEAAAEFRAVADIHNVAFHFVKESDPEAPGAIMFNLFEIDGPPGMEQGFLMDWPPRGAFKIREEAIFSTVLHQRMLPDATIKAFNRVECRSAEDYAEGIGRFETAFPRGARKAAAGSIAPGARPPIRSHLGLFEIVALGPTQPPAAKPSMRAIRLDSYGGPEALIVRDVPRPEPGPGQIRIRVKASAINPLDVKMRSGEVANIYPHWFPDVLGYSVSGIIDALGEGVSSRRIGEQVYGINNPIMRHGYAEYVVGPAGFFYPKPERMDFAVAAAAPSIFATAYGGLFLRANLQPGQTVLIHGGAGVIGSCAVQLASQAGAHVIATASARNADRVRKLGADVIVDYQSQRFEDFARDVDLVFDTVGGETRERSWPLLRKGGTLASLLPPPPDQAIAERYGVLAFMVHGHPNIAEILPEMTRRLEVGELAFPEIALVFPLEQAAQAHAAFERSAPRGRIVLTGRLREHSGS
jgi:NADPH:quinone reductase-like Zn-dependent oxidoreductase